MIRITETEKEYLLQIPIGQKERAKAITGRIWDPERTVWVYRRNPDTYRALITEFSDDLRGNSKFTPPAAGVVYKKPDQLEKENDALQKQVEDISRKMDALLNVRSDVEKISTYQDTILTLNSKISNLKNTLGEKTKETTELIDRNNSLSQKLNQQAEHVQGDSLNQQIKELAINSTGNDKAFDTWLNKHEIDDNFPDEWHKILVSTLSNIIKTKEKLDLFQLLEEIRDAELMSEEGIDWAHIIRKQRNFLKHDSFDPKTRKIRIIYLVTAYTLLWPHLMDSIGNIE